MSEVKMLAEWFIDAYRAAVRRLDRAADALLDETVQAMRRLYTAARRAAEGLLA